MTTSVFGAAFDRMPQETQLAYARAQTKRRRIYQQALRRGYSTRSKVVIIGDAPGPARPKDPNYHHTPFYSTKNSSFWMNRQLVEAGIDEESLLWFNAVHANGEELDPVHIADLLHINPTFIVLGGNAEKWFKKASPGTSYTKVYHPQFAKRFKSKEPYALIEEIQKALEK